MSVLSTVPSRSGISFLVSRLLLQTPKSPLYRFLCTKTKHKQPDPDEIALLEQFQVLSVGEVSNVRKLAGVVAYRVRKFIHAEVVKDRKPILLRSRGTTASSNTVKIIAVANEYLKETPGISIGFRVNHAPSTDKERVSGLRYLISAVDDASETELEKRKDISARRMDGGRYIGWLLAKSLRQETHVSLLAVGPQRVGTAVVGLTWARRILHQNQLDIIATPTKTSIMHAASNTEIKGFRLILNRAPYEQCIEGFDDPVENFDDENYNAAADIISTTE